MNGVYYRWGVMRLTKVLLVLTKLGIVFILAVFALFFACALFVAYCFRDFNL